MAYRSSSARLHLLVDSTGTKFLGEGEWKCKKHGAERRRQWRKLHIGIDTQALQVRAICVTFNDVSDAAAMPQLLGQRPAAEPWPIIKGDGAYFRGEVLFEVDCRLLAGGASSWTSHTADFFCGTRVPGYLLLGSSVHSRYRAEAALGDISTGSERSVAERQS